MVLFQKSPQFHLQDETNYETPQVKHNYQIIFRVAEKHSLKCNAQLTITKLWNWSFHWCAAKPGHHSYSAFRKSRRCITEIVLKLFTYVHLQLRLHIIMYISHNMLWSWKTAQNLSEFSYINPILQSTSQVIYYSPPKSYRSRCHGVSLNCVMGVPGIQPSQDSERQIWK